MCKDDRKSVHGLLYLCAMFSLEPLAQNARNVIMDLHLVKQFTPLPLPCSALPEG